MVKQRIKKPGGPGRIPNEDKKDRPKFSDLLQNNPQIGKQNNDALKEIAQNFFGKQKKKKKEAKIPDKDRQIQESQKYQTRMKEYYDINFSQEGPLTKIRFIIEETFKFEKPAVESKDGTSMKSRRSKRMSEIYYQKQQFSHLCYKLTYEQIHDKLQSQRDIFGIQNFQQEDQEGFVMQMRNLMVQYAQQLLFNELEIVMWLHILDQDCFDIINIRNNTGCHIYLEDLMFFLAYQVKVYLNQQIQQSQSQKTEEIDLDDLDSNIPNSALTNCILGQYHSQNLFSFWQIPQVCDQFYQKIFNLVQINKKSEMIQERYNKYILNYRCSEISNLQNQVSQLQDQIQNGKYKVVENQQQLLNQPQGFGMRLTRSRSKKMYTNSSISDQNRSKSSKKNEGSKTISSEIEPIESPQTLSFPPKQTTFGPGSNPLQKIKSYRNIQKNTQQNDNMQKIGLKDVLAKIESSESVNSGAPFADQDKPIQNITKNVDMSSFYPSIRLFDGADYLQDGLRKPSYIPQQSEVEFPAPKFGQFSNQYLNIPAPQTFKQQSMLKKLSLGRNLMPITKKASKEISGSVNIEKYDLFNSNSINTENKPGRKRSEDESEPMIQPPVIEDY